MTMVCLLLTFRDLVWTTANFSQTPLESLLFWTPVSSLIFSFVVSVGLFLDGHVLIASYLSHH
jgi:hypothetical protein